MSAIGPVIQLTIHAAERVLKRRMRVVKLLRTATVRVLRHGSSVESVRDEIGTLIRMIRAYFKGSYRIVPWRTIVLSTAALLYFVNPFDVIPDFLAGIGFVDDVAVISALIGTIGSDLKHFRDWEQQAVHRTPRNVLRSIRNRGKAVRDYLR